MEFRNTLEILNANANEIKQLMARLEKGNELSTIELDLILQKLRSIYDLVLDMQTAINDKEIPEPDNLQNNEVKVDPAPEPVERKVPEQKQQELKSDIREQIENDFKKAEIQNDEKKAKNAFVSDRFKTAKPSLNEEMAAKAKSNDMSSMGRSKQISNITNALGLNEKFELINELFGGDKEKFEQAMQELNMAGSFVEAYNYLNETLHWDMDNAYVQRILELIRRKLIVKRNEQ
jgi:Fe-S cluster assembly scaffold protein SufB